MTGKVMGPGIRPVTPLPSGPVPQVPGEHGGKTAFGEVLAAEMAKTAGLKFSAHAEKRLQSRQIPFTAADMAKLAAAVDKAAAKGAKESLILMQDLAFIVSVRNRTVITAIDGPSLKENVFTNIDSAVITE